MYVACCRIRVCRVYVFEVDRFVNRFVMCAVCVVVDVCRVLSMMYVVCVSYACMSHSCL